MLSAIAIDDEPSALELLEHYAAKTAFVQLQRTFFSTAEALAYLHQHPVDLIFLDVQMPDMLGTAFAKLVQPQRSAIIFTTAHPEFAVEGFALEALDYLLKPFDFGRFLQACNRALATLAPPQAPFDHIFVKEGYEWVRVNLAEVSYIQSDTNLLFIYETQRRLTTRMTLTEILEILPADRFLRVHKSYIVALAAIQKLDRHQVWVGKMAIPVAGAYRETLEQKLLKIKKP